MNVDYKEGVRFWSNESNIDIFQEDHKQYGSTWVRLINKKCVRCKAYVDEVEFVGRLSSETT